MITTLVPGTTLGQYHLLELIGTGGMAAVYRAYQASLDRVVALKLLRLDQASESGLERFRSEARTVARLRHANIVEVHDFLEHDGVAYLVTEYVEGGTLAHRLGAPLPTAAIELILRQIAAGLDFAHQHGVMHRDVKPSNILIRLDGTPVVADFGLAKIVSGAPGLTQDGMILGTPEFMAPEQALGLSADPRSDVYSLGVMVYQMVTGRLPFAAESPLATLYAHVHEPVPPVRGINPSIPAEIEEVLQGALAKSPADRYPSAGAFSEALSRAMGRSRTGEPTLVIRRDPLLAARLTFGRGARRARVSPTLTMELRARWHSLSRQRLEWGLSSSGATLIASLSAALALWAVPLVMHDRFPAPVIAMSATGTDPLASLVAPVAPTTRMDIADVAGTRLTESGPGREAVGPQEPAIEAVEPGDPALLRPETFLYVASSRGERAVSLPDIVQGDSEYVEVDLDDEIAALSADDEADEDPEDELAVALGSCYLDEDSDDELDYEMTVFCAGEEAELAWSEDRDSPEDELAEGMDTLSPDDDADGDSLVLLKLP